MFKKTHLSLAIGAALGLAAAMPTVALAQDKAAGTLEEVLITGSRIKRADLTGSNPVTVLDREAITNIGLNSIGDVLRHIPSSAGGAVSTGVNNGGSGATRFSLRGLGAERTLVMVNGRRVVASGLGANNSVDLNNIPVAMIERVEVLKDGASAVYGSDAISGVVNVITRKDFEGVELNVFNGQTSESDGEQRNVDLTFGSSSDKGNFVVSANWSKQGEIWAGDRDYSKEEIWYHPYWNPTGQATGGSSAPPWGNYNTADGRVTHGPDYAGGDTGYRPYSGATDSYNYAPANYTQTPNERWGFSFFGEYNIGDLGFLKDVNVHMDGWFTHRESQRLIAPEPLAPLIFFGHPAPISADSYYNQRYGPKSATGQSYKIDDWRRRMVETGGRDQLHETDTYQATFALTGEVGDGWEWEFNALYGENNANTIDKGYFQLERVADAVGPSFMDADGSIVCGVPGAVIAGCVPLNPFGIPGTDTAITPEMLAYISDNYISITEGGNEMFSLGFNVAKSNVFDLPAGPVGVAFGAEHRREEGFSQPDSLQILGVSTAGSSLPTGGSYEVDEIYGEAIIPILADLPMVKLLELSVAFRYSDYSTFGSTTNGKYALRWSLTDEFTVRATKSDAFRAPSIPELYDGSETTFPEATDPCAVATPSATCIANGVPVGGYDATGIVQLPVKVGGNTDLQPEEAEIFTVGMVYEPEWLEGSSFTVDYYDIELEQAISTIGAQVRLNSCAATGQYCNSIERFGAGSGAQGNIRFVYDFNENVGGIKTSGLDISANWTGDIGLGTLSTGIDATYIDKYDKEQGDGTILSHGGYFRDNSDGAPGDGNYPRWKANFSALWEYNDLAVGYKLRYIAGVDEVLSKWFNIDAGTGLPTNEVHEVSSNTIQDLFVSYQYEGYKVTLGVDNIADKQPPFVYSGFNDNTDPRTYSTQGRFYWLKLSATF